MRFNRRLWLAAGLALLGGAASAQPIRLGAVLPLTGPAAVIGTQEQRGILYALQQFNAKGGAGGRQVEVLFEDNQAKPDQSVLSFNKLVDLQSVPAVFTGFSGPSLAMAPLATRKKVLLVNGGAQADGLAKASPYLINTIPVLAGELEVLANYIYGEAGKKTAAILFENDAAGISGRDDFIDSYSKAGGKVLGQEPMAFGDTNYRPALLKLQAAQPDMLFVVMTSGLSPLADQIRQIDAKFTIVGNTFFADPEVIANANAEGWVHSQVLINAPDAMGEEFKKTYGSEFDFFPRQYYNATTIVLKCIEKLVKDGRPITGENLRAAVFEIKRFEGLTTAVFANNTAATQVNINHMTGQKDVALKVIPPK
jgi:branched-chain amino acid transport system substrate-binding protein